MTHGFCGNSAVVQPQEGCTSMIATFPWVMLVKLTVNRAVSSVSSTLVTCNRPLNANTPSGNGSLSWVMSGTYIGGVTAIWLVDGADAASDGTGGAA